MAQTPAGIEKQKLWAQQKKLDDPDFFRRIGAKGGKAGTGGGFTDRALAARAGAIGGTRGKRGASTESERKAAQRRRMNVKQAATKLRNIQAKANQETQTANQQLVG